MARVILIAVTALVVLGAAAGAADAANFTTTVARDGTGTGTVTSNPAGINCGNACSITQASNSALTLTAAPAAGSRFVTQSLCGATVSCPFVVDQDRTITFTFTKVYELTVTKSGSGSGTVSGPHGIDCGNTCSATLDQGTVVTLTATPVGNTVFTGWSGGGCSGTGTCQVTMDQAQTVNANFVARRTLSASIVGAGSGKITSQPAGIDCGADCTEDYDLGTPVTLTAVPGAGMQLLHWNGACTNSSLTCSFPMDQDRTVSAEFVAARTLTIAKNGSGEGTVTTDTGGINCGATCTGVFANTKLVGMTATPAPGSVLAGWSGGSGNCISTACDVVMDADKTVTVTFTKTHMLTVTRDGTGQGNVQSTPPGIDCGLGVENCSAAYNQGTSVTLKTQTGNPDWTFAGWTGGGCSGTGTCTVTMDAAKTVKATFNAVVGPVPKSTLTVNQGSDGSGTVTSPNGIDCGAVCTKQFDTGTTVTLTAVPDPDSLFDTFVGGGCAPNTTPCMVTLDQSKTVTAIFLFKRTVTVTKAGTGTGTVTSQIGGINCGATCSAIIGQGSGVVLTAVPAAGSVFTGWSGACTGPEDQCGFLTTADQAVTATFSLASAGTATPTPGAGTPTPGAGTPTPDAGTPTPGAGTPTPTATPGGGEASPTPTPTATTTGDTPDTKLKTAKIKAKKRRATFTFSSTVAGAKFECALARKGKTAKFKPCSATKSYKRLKKGRYVFQVRAVGDPTPTSRRFKI
jgi:hypothetical protein